MLASGTIQTLYPGQGGEPAALAQTQGTESLTATTVSVDGASKVQCRADVGPVAATATSLAATVSW